MPAVDSCAITEIEKSIYLRRIKHVKEDEKSTSLIRFASVNAFQLAQLSSI